MSPYRLPIASFWGRSELSVSSWIVTNVDRKPHHGVWRPSYTKAANVLLKLARNLIDRASDGRLDQWAGGVIGAVIADCHACTSAMAADLHSL